MTPHVVASWARYDALGTIKKQGIQPYDEFVSGLPASHREVVLGLPPNHHLVLPLDESGKFTDGFMTVRRLWTSRLTLHHAGTGEVLATAELEDEAADLQDRIGRPRGHYPVVLGEGGALMCIDPMAGVLRPLDATEEEAAEFREWRRRWDAATGSAVAEDATEQPCQHCGEPTRGQAYDELGKLTCRDCDMGRVVAQSSCRECLTWIIRPDVAGPTEAQHKAGCSLATSEDYGPRTEAELQVNTGESA